MSALFQQLYKAFLVHLSTLGSPLEFKLCFSVFEQCLAARHKFEITDLPVRFKGLEEKCTCKNAPNVVYFMRSFTDLLVE